MQQYVASQLKHSKQFISDINRMHGDAKQETLQSVEFLDGRVVEMVSRPMQVGENKLYRVWSFRDGNRLGQQARSYFAGCAPSCAYGREH